MKPVLADLQAARFFAIDALCSMRLAFIQAYKAIRFLIGCPPRANSFDLSQFGKALEVCGRALQSRSNR